MKRGGDKLVTNPGSGSRNGANGSSRRQGPHATVKFGSAVVPIYRSDDGRRVRFTIAYYRDGRRLRRTFRTLEAAKKEARAPSQ